MDAEYASNEQDVTMEPIDVECTDETGADVAAGVMSTGAPEINLQEDVEAETVHISQGGAQNVHAEKVFVEQGGIVRAEARFIDVHEGGVVLAQGENITISDGGAVVIAAENVRMEDSVAIFVAASQIEGKDTMVIFDVRAAVVFALVLGFVMSLFRFIGSRRH